MNSHILNPEVQQFIADHLNTEITKLILKGSPFKEVSVQELANQIIAKQKCKKKLPTWFSAKNLYYPPKLSIEQTSSEITAKYKSGLVLGDKIIDITGGFGIDCYFFSKQFKQVTHCEINKELSDIVKYNYQQLKTEHIKTTAINGFDYLKQTQDTFDCIYIDPSRRDDIKGKVFLLKDCQPYIPPKIDFFFTKAKHILIKVSPILDISNTLKDLKNVKEVHIVAVNNEVKELLFLLQKEFKGEIKIKTINFQKNSVQEFEFIFEDKAESKYAMPLTYLYEPNVAILKSGGFHQIAKQLNIFKLHQHSHLYTSNEIINFPGRRFKVNQTITYDKKKLRKLLPHKKANITSRNYPKTVAQFRKETKIKDGGEIYIFLTTNAKDKQILVICSKISN
ncbi:RsmD family RNA methyltransferase [Polaribacter sp. R77954]|uniref:THUMP-like domain-containing protein n=1 Tax=Polaribacter sp. R77954 TaxID=3093870 RepID=UPI0037C95EC4